LLEISSFVVLIKTGYKGYTAKGQSSLSL